jgi:hypothetical protein
MKVRHLETPQGAAATNQFVIEGRDENGYGFEVFQSYETTIARREYAETRNTPGGWKICGRATGFITLDSNALDHSRTTNRYLYQFLGRTRKQILAEIRTGEIKVRDLADKEDE